VFQFESAGMKRYLKQLKPTVFDDLIAMNALYRPGPMQFIEDFIDRKQGRKKVVYEHPGLKAALENTYGVLVYQEQFMQISKDMCGFTGGQADTLRKAIGKKQRETMAKMKTAFIEGMIEHSQVNAALPRSSGRSWRLSPTTASIRCTRLATPPLPTRLPTSRPIIRRPSWQR
jgi:DNA polymerase III alpha subunit